MDYVVHPSSSIDDDVEIGPGSRIWHFCHVMSGARIGAGVSLGQNVFVGRNVTIGDRCKVQNNVSIYEGVTLEDDVFCGPSVVFTNVNRPRAAFPVSADAYQRTLIRRGCTIGANATIVCGVTVGAHSFVGAGAVVTKDVADHALVLGVPAHPHGWACVCGAELRLQRGTAQCAICARRYHMDASAKSLVMEEHPG